MNKLVAGVVVALAGVVALLAVPSLRRYLKIERM
jgi:Tfp pilus assembly protein FimT